VKLREINTILDAEPLWGANNGDTEISTASCSDLLSDVLVFTDANALLITGLSNAQVIRTAEMVDISAVCFVNGKKPDESTVELAKEKKIPLITTELSMYESCGRLYRNGLPGCLRRQGK